MAKFYSNENLPFQVVAFLRDLGHDVLTSLDAGNANQNIPDEEVLQFAIKEDRAIITLNRKDFIRLHRLNSEHCGIVVCKVDADFARQAKRIDEEIVKYESLNNQLIRVNRPA